MKTPAKALEAQQKLFTLLSAPSRIRVLNELISKPEQTHREIYKRTGLSTVTAYNALNDLESANILKKTEEKKYRVDERLRNILDDLTQNAIEAQYAINRLKPRVRKSVNPVAQLRAIV